MTARKEAARTAAVTDAPAEATRNTLTRASVEAGITEAMGVLAATFTQGEFFAVLDNGKRQRIEDYQPEMHSDDPEQVVEINIYAFQQKIVLSGVVKQAEFLVECAEKKVQQQQFYRAGVLRKHEQGAATDGDLERQDEWLDGAKLQLAVALATFQAAIASYEDLTGEVFETKAMRLERERMGKSKRPAAPAAPARPSKVDAFNG